MRPGDHDGHGRYAQLAVSEDGELVCCHECGRWLRTIGTHAWYRHGLTAPEYRARHGLSTGQSLAAPGTRQRMRERPQATPGSRAQIALSAYRDPDAARQAMTAEGQRRPQLRVIRQRSGTTARRGRSLTPAEVDDLVGAVTIDGWSTVAQRLVDDGVRQAEISRVTGVPVPTVSQRLRRRR